MARETILFSRDREIDRRIQAGGTALVSPSSQRIAIYNDGHEADPGVHINSLEEDQLEKLTTEAIRQGFWGPDSNGLFVIIENQDLGYLPLKGDGIILVNDAISPYLGQKTWVGW